MGILNWQEGALLVKSWQDIGEKVVFTNGCFDILHRGHVKYLSDARALGDRLIIGVNTDASVMHLKGDSRPIQKEDDRAEILMALKSVDGVILFNEDTPRELIMTIKPDILVKGGDYTLNTIVGAAEISSWGGSVKVIPFLEGYSTTKIISKIKTGPEK